MILDKIENLNNYASLNPYIYKVVEFLADNDWRNMPPGRVYINGEDVFANFDIARGRTFEEAVIETHNRMVDIQLILDGEEQVGWSPRSELQPVEYNSEGDYSLYHGQKPQQYLTLRQGQFMLFLPEDGHAPCITPQKEYRKIIFKLKAKD